MLLKKVLRMRLTIRLLRISGNCCHWESQDKGKNLEVTHSTSSRRKQMKTIKIWRRTSKVSYMSPRERFLILVSRPLIKWNKYKPKHTSRGQLTNLQCITPKISNRAKRSWRKKTNQKKRSRRQRYSQRNLISLLIELHMVLKLRSNPTKSLMCSRTILKC